MRVLDIGPGHDTLAKARRSRSNGEERQMAARDEDFEITLNRNRTVTGWEWRLRVGDRLVPALGVFTKLDEHPADVLPRVLRKAMAEEGNTPPVERVGTDPLLRTEGVGPGPGRDHMR
jgi:hypothetical protein